jgi:hypothetical protein
MPKKFYEIYSRLEKLAKDKTLYFITRVINYICKKFYNIGPWP